QELAPRPGPVGQEVRLGALQVSHPLFRDFVASGVLPELGGAEPVHPGGIEAEDLRADFASDLRIAMPRPQSGSNLESAERLDLVLRRAVPDGVGAPENVVLPAMADQLAERVGGLLGLAHQEAPRAAEL